jgi:hypothetical protein
MITSLLLSITLAASTPPSPPVCDNLGKYAFTVAQYRDQGGTKSRAEAIARETVKGAAALEVALSIVDVVYDEPVYPAEAVRQLVVAACTASQQKQGTAS